VTAAPDVVQDAEVAGALERFADVVGPAEGDGIVGTLEEAALALACHVRGDPDDDAVGRALSLLDVLAVGLEPTLPALEERLFADYGLAGDTVEYDAPENSFLDEVLERRKGLPITLAVAAIAVGRRAGVTLAPVAMPGHFLVRHEGQPRVLVDCFAGGRRLSSGDCAAIVSNIQGRDVPFDLSWLEPVGARVVVHRMLANLAASVRRRSDRVALGRVLDLHQVLRG
jgi:regulator of sirC expression with transglutaminase-like and TPR domain